MIKTQKPGSVNEDIPPMLVNPILVGRPRAGLSSSVEVRGKATNISRARFNTCLVVILALTFLKAISPVVAAQEKAPGRLVISVRDEVARPIVGAKCSLVAAADLQKSIASATTDENGTAIITVQIPAGQYVLQVKADGFEEALSHFEVRDDFATAIEISMKVATVSENVTIAVPTDEATTVQNGSSTPAANLKRATLQRLPLATGRVDEALPLVPGVIRSAIGEINIAGATEQQSALLVNGLNAADPASGNFRLNLPLDAVESVQVFQHPYASEYGASTGGVAEVRTRRGGDRWHVELNDFLPDLRFVRGKIVGISDDTPHLNLNGPLIKDRLYLAQSASYLLSKQPVRGLSFPTNETKTEAQSYFSQLDWILSKRHTESFTFGYFPLRDQFVNLDFFQPQPTTPNYRQKDFVFAVRDNFQLAEGFLESAASYKRFDANVWGQGKEEMTITPTVTQGNYFVDQNRQSHRLEIFELYTAPARKFWGANHDIKAGFDFNSVGGLMDYSARPVNIVRQDGTLAERIVFRAPKPIDAANREYVGFVQDRLLVRPNLSFDLGVRFEDQRIAREMNAAPRFGFAWSPRQNDHTVIRGGIGVFYDKVPLNIRGFGRYPSRTITRYDADGATIIDSRHYFNVLVDTPPIEPLDFRRRAGTDAGFVPENLRWNLQLDQVVTSRLNIRANVTASRTEHIYIINPELDFRGRSGIVLRSAGEATYRAIELTARFRLRKTDQFFVSYVRSRTRGDLNDFNSYFGDFGAPVIRANEYSNLPFDVPNRLIAWGTISLPRRFSIAPIFEVRSGFPYSVRDAQQDFVGVRNSDRTRFPTFLSMDAEFAKEFQVTKKYGVRLSLKAFNLTNHFNPRDVHANIADPMFGQFFAPYHRFFSGGFDVLF